MITPAQPPKKSLRYPWLFALPEARMPARVRCENTTYHHVHTFKHDFFAATGLYRADNQLAVLKMGRATPIFTVPCDWLGRFLVRREVHMYRQLQDQPLVPRLIGTIQNEQGFLHEFIPGHPLGRDESVNDEFFPELQALLHTIHNRDMAYVDLNKRQNILMGDDQRPYLIDFQISLHCPRRGLTALFPFQWLLRRFQNADRYHFRKHKKRLRPDQLAPAENAAVVQLSFWIKLHRAIARPLTRLRRSILGRIATKDAEHVAGSDAK